MTFKLWAVNQFNVEEGLCRLNFSDSTTAEPRASCVDSNFCCDEMDTVARKSMKKRCSVDCLARFFCTYLLLWHVSYIVFLFSVDALKR